MVWQGNSIITQSSVRLFLTMRVCAVLVLVAAASGRAVAAEPADVAASADVAAPADVAVPADVAPAIADNVAPTVANDDTQAPMSTTISKATVSTKDIDKQIFLELIHLSRFNVRFHMEANRYQKWRSWSYPLGRESGTAVTFAGNLTDMTQQAKNLNHPRGIRREAIENAVALQITGNAISGTASGLELAQNTWIMWKARKQGYSPAASLAFVKERANKITALIAEREKLTEMETSATHRHVRELETMLMKRILQQLLFEFRTWSCHSRDLAWRDNTFYTIDSAQSFVRMTGAIIARKALDEPDLARHAIACALVSTSAATINPLLRNLVGITVRKYQDRKLKRELHCERPAIPAGLVAEDLKQLHANHPDEKEQQELLTRAVLLSERSDRIDLNLDREVREVARYRQIAQQQTISGPLIGLTGLAGATLSAVAFHGYRDEPLKAIKLGFAGRISTITGGGYALINTPYTYFKGARRNKKLRERGEHPTQLLKERLDYLDKFEAQVNATK